MNIILSKKGLDSSFSSKPISMTGGEMVFIPIVTYLNGNKVEITKDSRCHLDPQLINYFNSENFRGSFGQAKEEQRHLESHNVTEGDLILFYGWYKDKDDKVHTNGKNVLFGYMQIGEILKIANLDDNKRKEYEKQYPWLKYQPHWKNKDKYAEIDNNTLYIAREFCTFDNTIKGYGMFKYDKALDLTANDMKAKSCWKVLALAGLKTSRRGGKGQEGFNEQGQFRAPSRNQEIVVESSKNAQKWAENLIKKYAMR